jgi:hypothetical protein
MTLLVAMVVMWSQTSRADWQYTKWGMTLEEAIVDGKQYVAILSGLGGDPNFYYSAPKGGML